MFKGKVLLFLEYWERYTFFCYSKFLIFPSCFSALPSISIFFGRVQRIPVNIVYNWWSLKLISLLCSEIIGKYTKYVRIRICRLCFSPVRKIAYINKGLQCAWNVGLTPCCPMSQETYFWLHITLITWAPFNWISL